jgi:hypothetical protein
LVDPAGACTEVGFFTSVKITLLFAVSGFFMSVKITFLFAVSGFFMSVKITFLSRGKRVFWNEGHFIFRVAKEYNPFKKLPILQCSQKLRIYYIIIANKYNTFGTLLFKGGGTNRTQ